MENNRRLRKVKKMLNVRGYKKEKAYNIGFKHGLEKGIEIGKRLHVDKDYLDFEDGKITFNEYRQRKGLQPIGQ